MHDDPSAAKVISAILGDAISTAAVHYMSAANNDLFEVPNSLKPQTPNDLWAKYDRPSLESEGLSSQIDFETRVIPEPDTLDAFLAANQSSSPLAGLGLNLVNPETYKSRQDACSSIANCTGWWRFSGIGYNRGKTEALIHTDYDDPRYSLMGTGHFVLLHRNTDLWTVVATKMTWIS